MHIAVVLLYGINVKSSFRKIVNADQGLAVSVTLKQASVEVSAERIYLILDLSAERLRDVEIELVCSVGSSVIVKVERAIEEVYVVIDIVLALSDDAVVDVYLLVPSAPQLNPNNTQHLSEMCMKEYN